MRPLSRWTRAQRRGLLAVFGLSFLGHIAVYLMAIKFRPTHVLTALPEKVLVQRDSLLALQPPKDTLYPFNPNYMTAYHAYRLGLPKWVSDSIQTRISRREYFRNTEEVRLFLGVNDTTWLKVFPHLKLPEYVSTTRKKASPKVKLQLNTATSEQLQKVYGVGPVLAERILEMRVVLGGFRSADQLEDVWGLPHETLVRIRHRFSLDSVPNQTQIDLNTASINQLADNHYISNGLASRMVAYRSRHGQVKDFYQMAQSLEIDSVRIARIALYLNTKKLLE